MSEWYLGDKWDEIAQAEFEQKLKKSRGPYNKAQYLRIKGTSLLKSSEASKRQAGCELLKRVVNDFSNELGSVKYAFELMGDFYRLNKQYELSEDHYRKSISYYRHSGRSGTSGIGDVKLAELIVESDQEQKFVEMYELLVFRFEENKGSLTLDEDKFRYAKVLAQLCHNLDKQEEAKHYSDIALELAFKSTPQFENHPNVGAVMTTLKDLEILKAIRGPS